jgi:parallel beta-helix repeat protein
MAGHGVRHDLQYSAATVMPQYPLRLVVGSRVGRWSLVAALLSGAAAVDAHHVTASGAHRPVRPPVRDQEAAATDAAVVIYPGTDIQRQVDASAPGSTFLLKSGVHRMQTIRPKEGDAFLGEQGTVLSGARPLTDFVRSGSYWVATGQTQQGIQNHGVCQPGFPRCTFPEQLFFDSEGLQHVASLGELGPGRWYFDYDADRIYFADDPTWHRVETSVTAMAFAPTADHVTISGLTVERFANIAQQGAIHGEGRSDWVVTNNEVRWNHGTGIRVGAHAVVRQNYVNNNGQLGISASGADILVENNEIYLNNRARFFTRWEAGGAKFVATSNLVVRGNYSHRNGGPGLWTDIDNVNTLYEYNTTDDNELMGIYHEISDAAVIRNNIVRRNGFGYPDWIAGAGILVAGSPNVEIYGNYLESNADGIGAVQQNRGSGAYGPHELWNLWVHDNVIASTDGWTGMVEDVGDAACFTSRNNHFERNQYRLGPKTFYFTWMDNELTEAGWVAYGQDTVGTFVR